MTKHYKMSNDDEGHFRQCSIGTTLAVLVSLIAFTMPGLFENIGLPVTGIYVVAGVFVVSVWLAYVGRNAR